MTGAPIMRALPLDFSSDPKVADIRDEYSAGARVLGGLHHGAGSRQAAKSICPLERIGTTSGPGKKETGGKTITVDAPIDTIPLFVRARSIIPLGSVVESTHETQTMPLRVYPGADDDVSRCFSESPGPLHSIHVIA